ncbi:2-succinyl-5-enolpyruvyl-6-hydroxy-3-cyclohexene-1-carboxylic-acid synthase [Ornithinimicrobium pekingense]|uniref:2-succinyl-5-enolpyruvyl-6-hydroxy-3-cyclohexene-1-carboxylate synthase n=1 Tax=Ornithinimicrobium pekingense TaxID=384677 RepID=A0ABQ2FD42_9MICO|nr:2-succinyl-5-enolpyruvyl-6-hydroxy-3-cyclohexene-1-carboxylic-acid synthase [Ornithinimicrobium pekingense]GGK82734.1 2-succinyl-5-enolpyruvyl-6-hydroxy-3-cyclohexene-1-carboxylate synthase [Ornithinimicrobium pekingense]
MHPSTALAAVLVDELVRGGVREAVLCPGSRSAPLAYALEEADRAGRLRLHVRVDERSAAFLALGMARASGLPVPVVTTSGTAVANLHPAVLEAHHSGIPLVVLSADRPAELRGTGANQTTVQPGIFAGAVRWEADLPAPGSVTTAANAHWRTTVCRALLASCGWPSAPAGPVHLNVSLRDPLAPDLASLRSAPAGREGGRPWTDVTPSARRVPPTLAAGERTVVLLGDLPEPQLTRRALDWAQEAGWPVLAEPFGVLPGGAHVVPHGVLVATRVAGADDPAWAALRPDRVVVVGRLTLFRELAALSRLPGVRVEQVSAVPSWTDPGHVVHQVHPDDVLWEPPPRAPAAGSWVASWVAAGRSLTPLVREAVGLDGPCAPVTGPAVAGVVATHLAAEDLLVLGSSNAPRDLALVLDPGRTQPCRVVANRGLAGIDGMVSTAVGAALCQGSGRTVALLGDLTFLHDTNGLLVGPAEPRPELTVVVVNDDGGGIFSTLEYGEAARSATDVAAAATERVFGTPHGTDLAALCAAHRVPHTRAGSLRELADALAEPARGIRVVEVPVDRAGHRPLRDRLR